MATIHGTDLEVSRWCFGGNVLGWTVDRDQGFRLLDRFVDAGGTFIDTADVYSAWGEGNVGGESETIIGEWLASRRPRDVVVATKVGMPMGGDDGGLSLQRIREKVTDGLRRLQVETVDLLFAHRDDPDTLLEETLGAFAELVDEGLVRHVAASNYDADRLDAAVELAEAKGLARFCALESRYSLLERGFEGPLAEVCARRDLSFLPYFGLEKGFLTGKYRAGRPPTHTSERASRHRPDQFLDDRGLRILAALDEVADARGLAPGAVALAWLLAHPVVTAVLASARTEAQLDELVPVFELDLTAEEVARLAEASAPA